MTRLLFVTMLLAGSLDHGASAQSQGLVSGKWKATFTAPKEQQPKTFGSVLFDFKVDGHSIAGTATMGNWPGVCEISEGKLDGDHFSFVTIGEIWSSSGYPRYAFDGTVKDGVMKVTLTFAYAGNPAPGRSLPMEGKPVITPESQPAPAPAVAGTWTVTMPPRDPFVLTIALDGKQVSGTMGTTAILGEFAGGKLTFGGPFSFGAWRNGSLGADDAAEMFATVSTATLEPDGTLKGRSDVYIRGYGPQAIKFWSWTATRATKH